MISGVFLSPTFTKYWIYLSCQYPTCTANLQKQTSCIISPTEHTNIQADCKRCQKKYSESKLYCQQHWTTILKISKQFTLERKKWSPFARSCVVICSNDRFVLRGIHNLKLEIRTVNNILVHHFVSILHREPNRLNNSLVLRDTGAQWCVTCCQHVTRSRANVVNNMVFSNC